MVLHDTLRDDNSVFKNNQDRWGEMHLTACHMSNGANLLLLRQNWYFVGCPFCTKYGRHNIQFAYKWQTIFSPSSFV